MAFSLYAATIPSYLQILGSVSGLLERAEAFCVEKAVDPQTIVQAKLADDMLPFSYQVKSAAVHSLGSIEGVRRGVFSPDMSPPPETLPALKSRIAEATEALQAIAPAEIESFIGRDMAFVFKDFRVDFTAENFLLSFSLPNFYFHSTTAYDILRWKGVPIGKRDYLGKMRKKP
jgi:hypothetical protein